MAASHDGNNTEYDSDHEESGSSLQKLNATVRDLNTSVQIVNLENSRLRGLKNSYRTQKDEAVAANNELKRQVRLLEELIWAVTEAGLAESDADHEDAKEFNIAGGSNETSLDLSHPYGDLKDWKSWKLELGRGILFDSNKTCLGVPYFYGDRKEWKSWKLLLDFPFRARARLFPTEGSKIDFIRDRCRSNALDIMRFAIDGGIQFQIADEVIELLDGTFSVYDPVAYAEAMLFGPSFRMKENEIFDVFLARFTLTVAPLQYSDFMKIAAMQRTITPRLLARSTDGRNSKTFREFTSKLRLMNAQLRQSDPDISHGGRYLEYLCTGRRPDQDDVPWRDWRDSAALCHKESMLVEALAELD